MAVPLTMPKTLRRTGRMLGLAISLGGIKSSHKKTRSCKSRGSHVLRNDLEGSLRKQPTKSSAKRMPSAKQKACYLGKSSRKLCGGDDASSERRKPTQRPPGEDQQLEQQRRDQKRPS